MKNIENTTVSGRIILERGTESVLIPWFLLWCLHLTHGYQLFTQALFMSYTFQWLNDIENDPTYRSWPTGVQELLRATFPGVIRQIRRNFFNLVSPLKSGNAEGVVMIRGGDEIDSRLHCSSDVPLTWLLLNPVELLLLQTLL